MTAPTLILPERSRAIASDLRAAIGAEKVKDDYSTLTAYAVDASIYRMAPKAVVLVESEEDIAATVRYAVAARHPADAARGRNESDWLGDRVRNHSGRLADQSDSRAESRRALGSRAARYCAWPN